MAAPVCPFFLGDCFMQKWAFRKKKLFCKLTIIQTASSITSGIVRFQEGDGKIHPNTNDSIQHFFVKISPSSRKYFAPCESSWFKWQFRIQDSVQVTRFLIFSLVCKNRGNTKNSVNMMDWGHYYMVSGQIMNQLSCSSYLWGKADPLFLPPHVTWLTDSSDTDYKQ